MPVHAVLGAEHTSAMESLPSVTDGTFFQVPAVLPRGRHGLTREEVLRTHRERLMIAATELLASGGYRGVGVREVCARAGVSQAAFYAVFEDKDACIAAAYARFIEVLTASLLAIETDVGTDPINAFIATYLSMLQRDLVTARAFQVEMETVGRSARMWRRKALGQLSRALQAQRAGWLGATLPAPDSAALLVAVYAVRQAASDLLDEEPEPNLMRLVEELVPLVDRLL